MNSLQRLTSSTAKKSIPYGRRFSCSFGQTYENSSIEKPKKISTKKALKPPSGNKKTLIVTPNVSKRLQFEQLVDDAKCYYKSALRPKGYDLAQEPAVVDKEEKISIVENLVELRKRYKKFNGYSVGKHLNEINSKYYLDLVPPSVKKFRKYLETIRARCETPRTPKTPKSKARRFNFFGPVYQLKTFASNAKKPDIYEIHRNELLKSLLANSKQAFLKASNCNW